MHSAVVRFLTLLCLSSSFIRTSIIRKSSHPMEHRRLARTIAPPLGSEMTPPLALPGELTLNRTNHETHLVEPVASLNSYSNAPPPCPSTSDGPVSRDSIYQVLTRSTNHSWEFGTLAEYILEEFYPSLSVYPPANTIPLDPESNLPYPQELFELIDPILEKRAPGIGPIIVDDAAGDPASMLVAVMVMGATVKNSPNGWDQAYYNQVAKDQIDFLVTRIQRTPTGAISHRVKELQLWDDFMFMAPPSMVYYGAATGDWETLKLGYEQAQSYREEMQDPHTKTWFHIRLGRQPDETLWSTGNAWSAAGMMRMWATMNCIADEYVREQTKPWRDNLVEWVIEIVTGAYHFQSPESYLLQNRYGNATFYDVSGTALLAASAYRLATYVPDTISRLPMRQIDLARIAILSNNVDRTTGIVSPVVDPFNWGTPLAPNVPSPEGQAFVLFMITAWEHFTRSSEN